MCSNLKEDVSKNASYIYESGQCYFNETMCPPRYSVWDTQCKDLCIRMFLKKEII